MGISSLSAMIGTVFVVIGVVLFLLRKYQRAAITSLIVGSFLIVFPVSVIYLFFD